MLPKVGHSNLRWGWGRGGGGRSGERERRRKSIMATDSLNSFTHKRPVVKTPLFGVSKWKGGAASHGHSSCCFLPNSATFREREREREREKICWTRFFLPLAFSAETALFLYLFERFITILFFIFYFFKLINQSIAAIFNFNPRRKVTRATFLGVFRAES